MTGGTPRVLSTFEQTSTPVTVTNTGLQTWDPARVHLSYHWLWLVPRELASGRRRLPYQEGIRTDLGRRVAPGERVALDGRLLAPKVPGLYWLQWDMVSEGDTWFVQVSPRQPRYLVLIAPSLASVAPVLPLAAVLIGLVVAFRLEGGRRVSGRLAAYAAASDVVWCATALATKPFVLYQEASLQPTGLAYWLTIVPAVAAPIALRLLLPRRLRPWIVVGLGAFGSLLVVSDIVYYRYFGDLLSVPALLAAGQTGHVTASIRSLFTPGLVLLLADVPLAVWLAARLSRAARRSAPARRPAGLGAVAAAAVLGLAVAPLARPAALDKVNLSQVFSARFVVQKLSVFGYHSFDAWQYLRTSVFRPPATPAEIAAADAWFSDRAPLRRGTGPWFGAARGRNLIVIQVESLQDFAVDATVDGQEIMPHLRRWSEQALRFTDVTDQTNQGRTSDAEFTAMVSLLPLEQGAVAFRYPHDRYVGLPRVLAEHGYTTLSAVAFDPSFWNRRLLHPSYGFEYSLFDDDFTMTEKIGWGLNDRDFLRQMVPRLEQLPRPFGVWLITLSLHHPFDDFPDREKVLKLGDLEGTPLGGYLHGMHFFDQALADFMAALARDGLLDQSVVALFGDHDAGLPRDAAFARLAEMDPRQGSIDVARRLVDRVPFFIRVPGSAPPARSGRMAIPAGQTDFAPTLLALLGIDPAPLPWVGRNLLGEPGDPPVVRPFGEWLDRDHLFLPPDEPGEAARSCYAIARATFAAPARCAPADARARRAASVSDLVIADDLQARIRTSLQQQVQ